MKKAFIKTFGCQMNVHDSEKIAGILQAEGYDMSGSELDADLIVYNTCSIRQKAEQKFLSDIGRLRALKRLEPHRKIAVAGCIAQQMGSKILSRAPYVDIVIGPQNYHALAGMLRKQEVRHLPSVDIDENPHLADTDLPVLRSEGHRAWVTIMYGCNNFCTYCIVPYTRGREKSRPAQNILSEVRGLGRSGCREITLLGQNVNSYRDRDTDFPALLDMLNGVEGIERIRFVTSHPRDLSDRLMERMGRLDRLCEHIHLPLQSGSTRMLRAMSRRYTFVEYYDRIQRLRQARPDIAITTDIIAGFPGETEDDHHETMAALSAIRFDGIFAFKYSERPGTKAVALDGSLPDEVRLGRLYEILELQDKITLDINKSLEGRVLEALVEGPGNGNRHGNGWLLGRTRTNKIVSFASSDPLFAGKSVNLRITKASKHSLEGELVSMGQ